MVAPHQKIHSDNDGYSARDLAGIVANSAGFFALTAAIGFGISRSGKVENKAFIGYLSLVTASAITGAVYKAANSDKGVLTTAKEAINGGAIGTAVGVTMPANLALAGANLVEATVEAIGSFVSRLGRSAPKEKTAVVIPTTNVEDTFTKSTVQPADQKYNKKEFGTQTDEPTAKTNVETQTNPTKPSLIPASRPTQPTRR